eukprot:g2879.t1
MNVQVDSKNYDCTTRVLSMLEDANIHSPKRRRMKSKMSNKHDENKESETKNETFTIDGEACCSSRVLSMLEESNIHSPKRRKMQVKGQNSDDCTVRVLAMLDKHASHHSPKRRRRKSQLKSTQVNLSSTKIQETTILIIGIDNAGKTTIHNCLRGKPKQPVRPTVGFTKPFSIQRGKSKCTLYDLGGSASFRNVWERYYAESYGVMFVFDASDEDRLKEASHALASLSNHPQAAGKPLVIVANKQDKMCSTSRKIEDLVSVLCENTAREGLFVDPEGELGGLSYEMVGSCLVPTQKKNILPKIFSCVSDTNKIGNGKVDDRLWQAIDWLEARISERFDMLNKRVKSDVAEAKRVEEQEREERAARVAATKKLRADSINREAALEAKGMGSPGLRGEGGKKVICLNCNGEVATTKSLASAWRPVCEKCNNELEKIHAKKKGIECSQCGSPATKKSAALGWKPACDACDEAAKNGTTVAKKKTLQRAHELGARNVTIMLAGLDGAGKTTIHNNFRGWPNQEVRPTVGFTRPFTVTRGGSDIKLIDLGGAAAFRELWTQYYKGAHGVLFIVDAENQKRFGEASKELDKLTSHPQMKDKPIVVVANKQDLENAKSKSEIAKECTGLHYEIFESIASVKNNENGKVDDNLWNALDWLEGKIGEKYATLDDRVRCDLAEAKRLEDKEREERKARVAATKRRRAHSLEREAALEAKGEGSPGLLGEGGKKVICLNCNGEVATTKSLASAWRPVCEKCNNELEKIHAKKKGIECSQCGSPATKKSAALDWKPACDACDKAAKNGTLKERKNLQKGKPKLPPSSSTSTTTIPPFFSNTSPRPTSASSALSSLPTPPPSRPTSASSTAQGPVPSLPRSKSQEAMFSGASAAAMAADASLASSSVLDMVTRMAAEMADSVSGIVGTATAFRARSDLVSYSGSGGVPVGGSGGLLSLRRSGRKSPTQDQSPRYLNSNYLNPLKTKKKLNIKVKKKYENRGRSRERVLEARNYQNRGSGLRIRNRSRSRGRNSNLNYATNKNVVKQPLSKSSRAQDIHGTSNDSRNVRNSRNVRRTRSRSRSRSRNRNRGVKLPTKSFGGHRSAPANPNDWTYADLSREMDNLLSMQPSRPIPIKQRKRKTKVPTISLGANMKQKSKVKIIWKPVQQERESKEEIESPSASSAFYKR